MCLVPGMVGLQTTGECKNFWSVVLSKAGWGLESTSNQKHRNNMEQLSYMVGCSRAMTTVNGHFGGHVFHALRATASIMPDLAVENPLRPWGGHFPRRASKK